MILTLGLIYELIFLYLINLRLGASLLDLHDSQQFPIIFISIIFLNLAYFVFYKLINFEKVNFKTIFWIASILNISLCLVPFLTSDDIYSYIFQGRIFSIFGQNPYVYPYDNFSGDPLYGSIKTIWSSQTPLYGPVFILLSAFINLIGQNNLGVLVYLYKIIFLGAILLSNFLIYKITNNLKALYLFAFNPLVLFELSGNGHSEVLTILLLLLGIYFIYRKEVEGFLFYTSSVLIKYFTATLSPLFLIYLFKKSFKKTFWGIFWGGVLILMSFALFINGGKEIYRGLLVYYNGQFAYPSLGIILLKNIIGDYRLAFSINNFLFLGSLGVVVFKYFREKESYKYLIFYSSVIYFVYILTKLSLVLTWYLTPLIALSCLCVGIKEFKRWGERGILFCAIYGLGLYYLVR